MVDDNNKQEKFEKIISLSKRRGFIFPGSEIYGGLANTYDYGPMGVELMRNIRNLWWKEFVHQRDDIVGLEASLISHQEIWKASGHVGGFSDAQVDCKKCKTRMRADHLIEGYYDEQLRLQDENDKKGNGSSVPIFTVDEKNWISNILDKKTRNRQVEGLTPEQMDEVIKHFKIKCPSCNEHDWTIVRKFNLLFPVHVGIIEGDQDLAYLRGETAQGMFVAFKNILDSSRVKLPFGVAQVGKSFRNEITPGNSVFRTLVFEQAEIEYFFDPEAQDWENLYEDWKSKLFTFVSEKLGVKQENLRWRVHTDDERSFYSRRTEDLEYNYPFGFKELWGLAYRTDYDLSQHEKFSGKELRVVDSSTGQKILPHVIEPAVGVDRMFLMVLSDAYFEEDARIVLKIAPRIAPVKVAVFPLLANKEGLMNRAREIYLNLKAHTHGMVMFDARGNIGKRYLSQDEIGTPFCVTVDFESLENDTVTVRERDSAEQVRVKANELVSYITKKIE